MTRLFAGQGAARRGRGLAAWMIAWGAAGGAIAASAGCGSEVRQADADTAPPVDTAPDALFVPDTAGVTDAIDVTEVTEVTEDLGDAAPEDADATPDARAEVDTGGPIDCGDCDDGLACTNDVCGPDGVCQHHVKAGSCKVAGACLAAGEGFEGCRICVPDVNPNGLTSLNGGPCDDGDPCTSDEQCSLGVCGGGLERACAASSACHVSLGCDAELGCMEEALADGTPCGSGLVCVDAACVVGDGFAKDSVAWFDAPRCPTGWEAYAPANGRTLVPASAAHLGQQGGEALLPGAEPRHDHGLEGSVTLGTVSYVGVVGGGNGLAHPGTFALTTTVAEAQLGVPTLALLACKKTADPLGAPPREVFTFTTGACGEGSAPSLEGLDRLVVGTPEGGTAGATFGGAAGLDARPHDHVVSGDLALRRKGIALASGCCGGGYASGSPVPVSLRTTSRDSVFPWHGVGQCLAAVSADERPDASPPGVVVFSAGASCPPGLSPYEPARGRIIVGAATGGDVGLVTGSPLTDREDRAHAHAVTLALTLAQRNVAGANGGNDQGAAPGEHTTNLASRPATSGLPFRQLTACWKAP